MACFLNNARVQTRRRFATLTVVLSPCFAVFLLLLTQNSVSNHVDSNDSFKCGCKCLECCELSVKNGQEEYTCFNSTTLRPCSPYSTCMRHDEGSCGYLYSTVEQVPFCDVKQPPLWPPILQVPTTLSGDRGTFLYTGNVYSTSSSIMEQLLMTKEFVSSNVAESYIKTIVLDEMEPDDDDEFEDQVSDEMQFIDATGALTRGLYDFGVVLGTSAKSSGTLLIEIAFIPRETKVTEEPSSLYLLVRDGMEGNEQDTKVVGKIGESISNLTGISVSNLYVETKFLNSSEDMNSLIYKSMEDSKSGILGAFDWHSSSSLGLQVDIWVNNIGMHKVMEVPEIQRWAQLINLATNAYIRRFYGGSIVLAGVKDMPRKRSELQVDFSILFGPLLTMWVMHVVLPVQLYFIIYEKEYGLRIYQNLNGVLPGCHFYAIYFWHFLLYVVCMSCLVGLGTLFGIKMFVMNSYSVQFVFFILWGIVITSFGFLYAAFFKEKRSVALSSIFYILITGFLANVFLVLLIEQDMNALVIVFQSLIPSFCAFRGLYELAAYAFLADQTGLEGLTWSTMKNDQSMMLVLIQLACQSIIIPIMSIYFDKITGSFDGLKREPLFFLKTRNLRCFSKPKKQKEDKVCPISEEDDALDHYLGYLHGGAQYQDDFDGVSRKSTSLGHYLGAMSSAKKVCNNLGSESQEMEPEEASVRNVDNSSQDNFSILLQGVKKSLPGDAKTCIHLPCLTIQSEEIFAFLGTTGSYKSTLLKMMQGLVHQDEGIIRVHGIDSRESLPEKLRMGVVFDVDILWTDLTGMENLLFFSRIKLGHISQNIQQHIDNVIDVLDLQSSVGKIVSKCSAGVRRRLSLAISLIGYPDKGLLPEIIFMDEPSLSMDPYSRKLLWRVLREVKNKSSIVISTSSIVEAESCDRISVMKDGHPIYIGSPQHLIYKYGRCMWLSFATKSASKHQVIKFVKSQFQGAELLCELGQKVKFSIPIASDQTIDSVFRKVEKARIDAIDVLDWSISNSTLEDVYLHLIESN